MPNNCVTATVLLCFFEEFKVSMWPLHAGFLVPKQSLPKTLMPPHGLPSSKRGRKAGSLIAMFHFIKPVKVFHQMLVLQGAVIFFFFK